MAPCLVFTLPGCGCCSELLTNVVARASAKASELTREELVEGGRRLAGLVAEVRPKVLAVLGVSAYRTAFARPKAVVGLQEESVGGVPVWVLPNPSGLNAHWTLAGIAGELRRVREHIGRA
ncbi:uracil-DNA glycosylase family protein [Nonomuraea roseoviolacea]|uniref:uracil-DNA glycosylase family protein n=1 Tax=Nonomuraea roseoviolacea TaxID=103837 RepID=UPI0031E7CCAE